jgi:DNA-binding transcriptional MerR regulator/predicted DNA-binding transcriptional regulator AlpA
MTGNPPLVSQSQAARMLGVAESRLKKFVEQGLLVATARSEQPLRRIWQLIDAESVEGLRAERSQYLTLEQVAELISLSKRHVVALVAAGIIEAEHGPLVDNQAIWEFAPHKVDTTMQRLIGHIPVQLPKRGQHPNDIADFQRGQHTMTMYGVGLPRLIFDIHQGVLPAFRALDEMRFDVLWFHSREFSHYHHTYRLIRPGSLSITAVCERLNCKPTTLRRLYGAGLLVPITDKTDVSTVRHLYDKKDVAAFLEQYIDSSQVAELLGITQLTVQNWVRNGRLVAVTGPGIDGSHSYRFEKALMTQWINERLTFGQTMKLLGVSKATLHRWVVDGKLRHIEGMGGKQRWFWRAEVVNLVEQGR